MKRYISLFIVIMGAAAVSALLVLGTSKLAEMTRSKPIIGVILDNEIITISDPPSGEITVPDQEEMPPGYTLMCDIEKGYYAAKMPMPAGHIIKGDLYGNPFKTKQAAIDKAWRQYNYSIQHTYNWQECN